MMRKPVGMMRKPVGMMWKPVGMMWKPVSMMWKPVLFGIMAVGLVCCDNDIFLPDPFVEGEEALVTCSYTVFGAGEPEPGDPGSAGLTIASLKSKGPSIDRMRSKNLSIDNMLDSGSITLNSMSMYVKNNGKFELLVQARVLGNWSVTYKNHSLPKVNEDSFSFERKEFKKGMTIIRDILVRMNVPHATCEHAREYKCDAKGFFRSNSGMGGRRSKVETFYSDFKAYYVRITEILPQRDNYEDGQNITFTCEATGDEGTTVKWQLLPCHRQLDYRDSGDFSPGVATTTSKETVLNKCSINVTRKFVTSLKYTLSMKVCRVKCGVFLKSGLEINKDVYNTTNSFADLYSKEGKKLAMGIVLKGGDPILLSGDGHGGDKVGGSAGSGKGAGRDDDKGNGGPAGNNTNSSKRPRSGMAKSAAEDDTSFFDYRNFWHWMLLLLILVILAVIIYFVYVRCLRKHILGCCKCYCVCCSGKRKLGEKNRSTFFYTPTDPATPADATPKGELTEKTTPPTLRLKKKKGNSQCCSPNTRTPKDGSSSSSSSSDSDAELRGIKSKNYMPPYNNLHNTN